MTDFEDDGFLLIHGDCVEVMAELDENSIDAIVTDPPYGLGFMGREWDAIPPGQPWAEACLRILKPGGHLLAFGGTRTYHRLAVAIEDAGFEIRDTLAWLYGSGFPKSLDVSKAIDKAAGAEREVVGVSSITGARHGSVIDDGKDYTPGRSFQNSDPVVNPVTAPATPEAERWQGWGTALKPAHEPIVMARKPLIGTVTKNVLEHGTGAINVDGCKIAHMNEADRESAFPGGRLTSHGAGSLAGPGDAQVVNRSGFHAERRDGRWPANVILSHTPECEVVGTLWNCSPECPVRLLDEQAGDRPGMRTQRDFKDDSGTYSGRYAGRPLAGGVREGFNDKGGPSRFFYTAKVSRKERTMGGRVENKHPTVKPIALMRYLIRLVTPPGGIVLDPFIGSGTTALAAHAEGFMVIGIEKDQEYFDLIVARWKERDGA